MTNPLPCPTPKSGEIEAERSGGDSLLILRHKLHMGDLGTGPVFDALASLETLIKYGRWQVGRESMSHHPTLPSAVANASSALDAALLALRAAPASPAGENGRGPGIHNENKAETPLNTWGAKGYQVDYSRAGPGATPRWCLGLNGVGHVPIAWFYRKADAVRCVEAAKLSEDLQRLRAALESANSLLQTYGRDEDLDDAEFVRVRRQVAQALSSVVGGGDQGLSSATADLGGDGERAATEGQRKSEGGGA